MDEFRMPSLGADMDVGTIIEWLVKVATGLWAFLAGLFPDWVAPPELSQADGMIAQLAAYGQGLEPFANWSLLATLAMALSWGVWLAVFDLPAARRLAAA